MYIDLTAVYQSNVVVLVRDAYRENVEWEQTYFLRVVMWTGTIHQAA